MLQKIVITICSRRARWLFAGLALAVLLCAGGYMWIWPGKTAVLVDQLSLGYPNPEFVETVTSLLRAQGYRVSYVPNPEITVEFFRTLPSQGYDLILLRVHSSASAYNEGNEIVQDSSVSFCTGEPLSKKYPRERNSRQLGGFETPGVDLIFFSVRGDFFAKSAVGRFDDSVIVMMGCESLSIEHTARVLLDLGARAVVGWSDKVTPDFMDQSILHLLQSWLADDRSLHDALEHTRSSLGTDPHYPSTLMMLTQ